MLTLFDCQFICQHACCYATDVAGATDDVAEEYQKFYMSQVEDGDTPYMPGHRETFYPWADKKYPGPSWCR